jgi:hypothetical protein
MCWWTYGAELTVKPTDVKLRNRRSQVRILSGALFKLGANRMNKRSVPRSPIVAKGASKPNRLNMRGRDHRATIAQR